MLDLIRRPTAFPGELGVDVDVARARRCRRQTARARPAGGCQAARQRTSRCTPDRRVDARRYSPPPVRARCVPSRAKARWTAKSQEVVGSLAPRAGARFGIPAALSVHKRWSVREALQLRGVARQARPRDVDAERRAEVPGELHQAAQSPDPNRLIISLASAVVAISRRSGWARISSANSARSAAGSYSTVPAIRANPPAPPNRTPFGGTGPYCARSMAGSGPTPRLTPPAAGSNSASPGVSSPGSPAPRDRPRILMDAFGAAPPANAHGPRLYTATNPKTLIHVGRSSRRDLVRTWSTE